MRKSLRLIALSGLMLFTELVLIRWLGSNVLYLSYFSNFVLLGSFLGIGVGFLLGPRFDRSFHWFPFAIAALVGFVDAFPVAVQRTQDSFILVGDVISGLPAWQVLPIIFLFVAITMGLIAHEVARVFRTFDPLDGYRLDIFGSLLGIATFTLVSWLETPPLVWGAILSAGYLALALPRPKVLASVALCACLGMLGFESVATGFSWSPYYKIHLLPLGTTPPSYDLTANGVPHQTVQSLAEATASNPLVYAAYLRDNGHPKSVLIIGAGNGKDVASALAHGAAHVDAVEIDPRIYQIGTQLNPDRPYADPRVTVYVDDGRAFLEHTSNKYDLIVLAQTDSITLVLGQSSLRLESYLFTQEAMENTLNHLNPHGVFAAYNFYWQRWYVDRLGNTLQTVFGHPPCFDSLNKQGDTAVMTVGIAAADTTCAVLWSSQTSPTPVPVHDDYPFAYLQNPGIPGIIAVSLVGMLLIAALFVRAAGARFRPMFQFIDLFFMGAAFLLLETKNVVQFALLFGTTWLVNAIVFAGVLVAIILAVELSRHVRIGKVGLLYGLLLASLAVAWMIPSASLLHLDFGWRLLAAVTEAFAPIFIANLVFAQRFRAVGDSTTAFAANLLGAMLGGVLEYGALLVGYRALLIVAALLYALAFAFTRLPSVRGGGSSPARP